MGGIGAVTYGGWLLFRSYLAPLVADLAALAAPH
jgi:hypothetical protein